MHQHLINLTLALAAGELVHNAIETYTVREKVHRLSNYMAGKPFKELPLNINTRAKSYGLSLVGLLATTAVFYVIFNIISLSLLNALYVIVILLLLAYIVTAVSLDKYHVDIEVITKPFKDKLK